MVRTAGWTVAARALAAAAVALVAAALLGAPPVEAAQPRENEIKAAFLYNFAKFVEWPQEAPVGQPFVIAILGSDALSRAIETSLAGQDVEGRPIAVRRIDRIAEALEAEILYIAASEEADLPVILRQLRGQDVLTVGNFPRFAERGCVIGFDTDGQRVRFEINLASAQQARLKISSQLLKLARLIP